MRTSDLFLQKRVLSFEVFPPKRSGPIDSIYQTIERLQALRPDFISVTYGAGGGENSASTLEIASAIRQRWGIESVAHLPGIGLTRGEVLALLRRLEEAGIENILALRGDAPAGEAPRGDFRYASDLMAFIRQNGDFNLVGACYPEGHPESGGAVNDLLNLRRKVDAGADHLISQLFFDNRYFYDFWEKARIAGINVPIEAGIMPVVNARQIERMVTLCRATLPPKFLKIMGRYEHSPEAMRDAGIAYAVDQIVDLITQGVDGVHLYTMNNPEIARRIAQSVASLMAA